MSVLANYILPIVSQNFIKTESNAGVLKKSPFGGKT